MELQRVFGKLDIQFHVLFRASFRRTADEIGQGAAAGQDFEGFPHGRQFQFPVSFLLRLHPESEFFHREFLRAAPDLELIEVRQIVAPGRIFRITLFQAEIKRVAATGLTGIHIGFKPRQVSSFIPDADDKFDRMKLFLPQIRQNVFEQPGIETYFGPFDSLFPFQTKFAVLLENLNQSAFGGRCIKRYEFEPFAAERDPDFLQLIFRLQDDRRAQQLKNRKKQMLHVFFLLMSLL